MLIKLDKLWVISLEAEKLLEISSICSSVKAVKLSTDSKSPKSTIFLAEFKTAINSVFPASPLKVKSSGTTSSKSTSSAPINISIKKIVPSLKRSDFEI